jgi:site-specific DNA recombinase
VVRDIYARYADGQGFKKIAHALNAQHRPSPRPQRHRPAGWDPGTVRAILRRQLYRGIVVYGRTKKRDAEGSRHQHKQDRSTWLVTDMPALRIVTRAITDRVDARLDSTRHAYLRDRKGRLLGSPRRHGHNGAQHLLAGFIVCECGATFEAVRGVYVCSARRRKGATVCPSDRTFNIDAIDRVFLDALEDVVLAPAFIDRVLDGAFVSVPADDRISLLAERSRLATEIANLTTGIAAGGNIPALAQALAERDTRLKTLDHRLAHPVVQLDREALKAALELRTADWRGVLRGPHIAQARVVLQHLLELPIRVVSPSPQYVDTPGVLYGDPRPAKWIAAARPEGLTVGLIQSVASPTGFEPVSWP